MQRSVAALAVLLTCCAAPPSRLVALGDEPKDADLRAKIQELEKRVAELEQALKEKRAPAKEAPQADNKELDALIGTWNIDTMEWGGRSLPKELMTDYKFVFAGNKLT